MLIDSEIKQKNENDMNYDSNPYNEELSEILSIEIPKTKVIVRKRPLNQKEIASKEVDNISIIDQNKVVLTELKKNLDLRQYLDKKEFIFDKAYDEKSSNDLIYRQDIRPMIYNAFYQKTKITCFAYGQTGSGKTYTLFGNTVSPSANKNMIFGLYALAGYDIFQIKNFEKKFQNFSIFVSFYEIYCDKLYDLLNNRNRLETREDHKHDINIIGLSENKINSLEELIKIVNFGSKQRTIGKTGANSESSRSHGIIQLRILDTDNSTEHVKISFIDLAGSERESDKVNVDKKTRIDGAAINQSLLALKECIRALEQDKIHLPFRGSKLTLVLRDSFIGNCKTLMISTISPGYKTSEHTLNTLRYAYRLKEIKSMGNAAKNFKSNNNNKNMSKNNNDLKNDPNMFISNLLKNNNNFNFNNNNNNNSSNNNNNRNNNNTKSNNNIRNISSDSKNQNEKDLLSKMNKRPIKRKKSYSSSNSSMRDIRDNSNESKNYKRKKEVKINNNYNNINNIKPVNDMLKANSKKEVKNEVQKTNNNNIYNLTLMTSNNNKDNLFNPFNQNTQMNITQRINLNNNNLQNPDINNNHNFSFNLFNENNNILNLSSNSLLSFQSNNFNNLSLEELEKKNDKMIEDIVNQEKIVKKSQQTHINSMCELIKTEISTFQKYQQEQMDITTYIEAMQNILKSENNQYTDFNTQLEKLNYMIKQQIKLSDLIEQMKKNENNKLSLSDNILGNDIALMEDQNIINLKHIQNIQSQINGFSGNNGFQ